MNVKLKALIPLFVFLALGALFAVGLTKDPSVLPTEMIDKKFPDFSLPDLMDENIVLDNSYFHGQVVLVNVFGSWCVACDQEHPTLVDLARRGEVTLLGVDWRDTREKGKAWLARRGNPYTRTVFDEDSQLAIDLGVTGAPESFLVGKNGRIRYKYIGPILPKVWEDELGPMVKALQAEQVEAQE